MSSMHLRTDRALSFGGAAEAYERSRPTYPEALIDDLMALQPHDVLDVGAGTGKAGRMLVARGCTVTGVEPDARMAAIARRHGYQAVDEARFEDWDARERSFDLIVSGQAWHWVDPEVGPRKARSLLRDTGHLAAFWNLILHQETVRARLTPVYARFAPQLVETTQALGVMDNDDAERAQQLADLGGFLVEARTYQRDIEYTREQWLDYLGTCSDHLLLPKEQRAVLLHGVGEAIDGMGGAISVQMGTVLLLGSLPER